MTGDFICGVVDDPVPQFVAYGNGIECSKRLTQASKGKTTIAKSVEVRYSEVVCTPLWDHGQRPN